MRRFAHDQLLHLIGHCENLVDPGTVEVARLPAEVAADAQDEVVLVGRPAAPLEERALLGALGLSAVIGKLDYVLLPAMAIFLAVLIYGLAKRRRAVPLRSPHG